MSTRWLPLGQTALMDRLTHAEAAALLGVHEGTVARMVRRGELKTPAKWAKAALSQAEVERLSLARWSPGSATWLTIAQAAEVFGVTPPRVRQLANSGRLPYERSPAGRRLFRPAQVAVIARARRERFGKAG